MGTKVYVQNSSFGIKYYKMEIEGNTQHSSQGSNQEPNSELLQIDRKCVIKENDDLAKERKHMLDEGNRLFAEGELELALVHYYRGKRLQSAGDAFQPHIDKTVHAINSSITGDYEKEFREIEEVLVKGGKIKDGPVEMDKLSSKLGDLDPSKIAIKFRADIAKKSELLVSLSPRQDQFIETVKSMHNYLQKQKNRTRVGSGKSEAKSARRLEAQQRREEREKKADSERSTAETILGDMEELWRHCQTMEVIRVGQEGLDFLTEAKLPSKEKYNCKAKLLDHIVQAHLENANYKEAVQCLDELEELARMTDSAELQIASQTMRGQVLALSRHFAAAADVWVGVCPRITDESTKAWLYHELGRCNYELGKIVEAQQYGSLSLEAAKSAGSDLWTAHALILSAQIEALLGCYQHALRLMQQAAGYASCLPQPVVLYLQKEQVKLQEAIGRIQGKYSEMGSHKLSSRLMKSELVTVSETAVLE